MYPHILHVMCILHINAICNTEEMKKIRSRGSHLEQPVCLAGWGAIPGAGDVKWHDVDHRRHARTGKIGVGHFAAAFSAMLYWGGVVLLQQPKSALAGVVIGSFRAFSTFAGRGGQTY